MSIRFDYNNRKKRLITTPVLLLKHHNNRVKRRRNKHRKRLNWDEHVSNIGEVLFQRAYRLNLKSFNELLLKIHDRIEVSNIYQVIRSSGSYITPEIMLASTLRWLAGGSYIDICFTHGISVSSFYNILWEVIDSINSVQKIDFP